LEVGIHLNEDLSTMCDCNPKLGAVVLAYLDKETERMLAAAGHEIAASAARATQSDRRDGGGVAAGGDWSRRQDDAVTDSDLARLLMRVHPAYTLSNDARLFLCSLSRELLNESVAAERSAEPASPVTLIGGQTGALAQRHAARALDRYALISAKGKRVKFCFRLAVKEGLRGKTSVCTGLAPGTMCKMRMAREAPFAPTLVQACERLRIDKKKTVFVYAGRLVQDGVTPRKLGMDSDSGGAVQVFAVPHKWWIYKQREQARKGLLTSVKSIDVSQIVSRANAKVDNTVSKDALKQLRRSNTSSSSRNRNSSTRRRSGNNSGVSGGESSSGSRGGSSSSGGSGALSGSASDPRFKSRLRALKSYGSPDGGDNSSSSSSSQGAKKRRDSANKRSPKRFITTPRGGSRADLSGLDGMEVEEGDLHVRRKGGKGPRVSSKGVPFPTKKHKRRLLKRKEPSEALRREIELAKKEKERKAKVERAEKRRRERERQEREAREEREKVQERNDAIVKIQSKVRSVRQRREFFANKQKRAEKVLLAQREKRLRKFGNIGRGAMRESVRTVEAWDKVKRVLKETPQWTSDLEKSLGEQRLEDEEQECFARARKLRAVLFEAETQTSTFQRKASEALGMLEHWDQHLNTTMKKKQKKKKKMPAPKEASPTEQQLDQLEYHQEERQQRHQKQQEQRQQQQVQRQKQLSIQQLMASSPSMERLIAATREAKASAMPDIGAGSTAKHYPVGSDEREIRDLIRDLEESDDGGIAGPPSRSLPPSGVAAPISQRNQIAAPSLPLITPPRRRESELARKKSKRKKLATVVEEEIHV
jgi:uncharacterized membrane protein YgcG